MGCRNLITSRSPWFLLRVCIAFFLIPNISLSQNNPDAAGAIRGSVLDKDFGDPLSGARIQLQELDRTVRSQAGGSFIIEDVPPGVYTLSVSKNGFNKVFRRDVLVTGGKLTDLTVELAGKVFEMNELVVTGSDLVAGSEVALLELRQESTALMDSVGAELISKAGASDAADALKQVVGATVSDGKFATVRGLADRYTKTVVNGMSVPSPDPEKRAVQLDIFPASTIESIEVSKTFTPDLPGDASGGLVNIKLKSIPEEPVLKFSLKTGANSKSTFKDTFPVPLGGTGTHFTGIDGGRRDLNFIPVDQTATAIANENFVNGIGAVPAPNIAFATEPGFINYFFGFTEQQRENVENLDTFSRQFGSLAVGRASRGPDYGLSFTLGNKLDLNDDGSAKVGAIASFVYDQKYRIESADRNRIVAEDPVVAGGPVVVDDTGDTWKLDTGKDEVSWSTLVSLGFQANEEHRFDLSVSHNQLAEQEALTGVDSSNPNLLEFLQTTEYTERQLSNIQLKTEHDFPALEDLKVEFKVGASRGSQNQPDTTYFKHFYDLNTQQIRLFDGPRVAGEENQQRVFRNIEEVLLQAGSDFTLPLPSWVEEQEGKLKWGMLWEETNRDFDQPVFSYNPSNVDPAVLSPDVLNSQEQNFALFFDDLLGIQRNGLVAGFGQPEPNLGFVLEPSQNVSIDYEGRQNVQAFYAMTEVPVTPKFQVNAGARVEQTFMSVEVTSARSAPGALRRLRFFAADDPLNPGNDPIFALDFDRDEDGPGPDRQNFIRSTLDEVHFLPALGFTYQIAENMNLKAAYSHTIARPTFREFSPALQRDQFGGEFFGGNPDLEISEVTNYDVRWEWFPAPGDVFATSFFYKHIEKPIELVNVNAGEGEVLFPFNFDRAEVWGAEFEIRKTLGFVSEVLKYFSVGTNFTFVQSRAHLGDDVRSTLERFSLDRESQRLQGQPDWLFNANLSYSNPEWGSDFGAFFNWESDSLISGAAGGFDTGSFDIYKEANFALNFTYSQKIMEHVKLKLSAKNVFDPEIRTVYKTPEGKRGRTAYHKGMDFSMGISTEW
ncbi:MAG: TonB-dependent receptor [Verrucomicrobiota bacterium]